MRAVTWQGRHKISVETVPDPEIVNPRDIILKVTSTAICGSDLHLYDGYIPACARATSSGMSSWARWSIQDGKFDTTSLVSHHAPLEDAAEMYRHWHGEQNDYTKIILKPGLEKGAIQAKSEMEHA